MSPAMGARPICPACRSPTAADDRFCRRCGAVLGGGEQTEPESRTSVAILFVDLVGSTTLAERLDPEVLRGILDRYYQVCASCIADHGGTIEKYIGDAIMAVFGVPVSHEDDAVRAVRAGHASIRAVVDLGVELDAHAGVSTGEVVVIARPGTHLRIIGDPVNTAARLQSAAAPGELLVNEQTAQLVRELTSLEQVPPLDLKGKTDAVPAWRVTGLLEVRQPIDRTPLVDRLEELGELDRCHRIALQDRRCQRVRVSGAPGIGKSRLVREFLARRDAAQATVLTGRCQPYGRDLTYQPLVSMLNEAFPRDLLPLLGDGGEAGRRAAHTLAVVRGDDRSLSVGVEEISWATARLFAALANRRPLVLVWEDLHWAEPNLLGLIDELSLRLADLPVLQLCVSRNGIDDWSGENWSGSIHLRSLGYADTLRLVHSLIRAPAEVYGQEAPPAAAQIAETCEGNPLFAIVMADMSADELAAAGTHPTVAALLRARIDALPRAEKLVLQMAATCGRDFEVAELEVLIAEAGLQDGPELERALMELVHRELIQPKAPGRFRFAQTLVHDTAYVTVAKGQRARWHAGLAASSTESPDRLFHSEAACLLYLEINPDETDLPDLVEEAVDLLTREGTTALHRKDLQAAIGLLHRALFLVRKKTRSDTIDAAQETVLLLRLSDALLAAGETEQAAEVLAGEEPAIALQRGIVALRLGRLDFSSAQEWLAAEADDGDDLERCLLHQARGWLALGQGRGGDAVAAFREALRHAVELGDQYIQDRLLGALCELAQWSPTTVQEGLTLCAELEQRFQADRLLLVPVSTTRARLLALADRVDEAQATLDRARASIEELHAALAGIALTQTEALVHSVAGQHDAAGALFETAATSLRAHGHERPARTLEVYAVREQLRARHVVKAATGFARLAASVHTDDVDDARARIWLSLLEARLSCEDGRPADGVESARRAVRGIESDDPCLLGDASFELAVVLRRAGLSDAAVEAAVQARSYYEAKGAIRPAADVSAWLAEGSG